VRVLYVPLPSRELQRGYNRSKPRKNGTGKNLRKITAVIRRMGTEENKDLRQYRGNGYCICSDTAVTGTLQAGVLR